MGLVLGIQSARCLFFPVEGGKDILPTRKIVPPEEHTLDERALCYSCVHNLKFSP